MRQHRMFVLGLPRNYLSMYSGIVERHEISFASLLELRNVR